MKPRMIISSSLSPGIETQNRTRTTAGPGRRHTLRTLLSLLPYLFLLGATEEADAQAPVLDPVRARVENVTFEGARAIRGNPLREAVATQESRCRGFLLIPFCWFTDWHVLVEREYLDPEALPLDELRLEVLYFREGFREAAVSSEVHGDEQEVEVVFMVEEGPATTVREREIHEIEDVLSSRDIRRARVPQEGERLSLSRLEDAMEALADALGERGHLDAVVRDSIALGPDPLEARLELVVDPGPRSTVRAIEITGNEDVTDGVILQALPFEEGDILNTNAVREGRNSLHASNLFFEAQVTVPDQPDSAKVVRIQVREAPPRLSRIGGGFNTLEFAQVEARFTHYNWLGGGRRLDLRGSMGNLFAGSLNGRFVFRDVLPGELAPLDADPFLRPTWHVSVEFAQPHFRGARNTIGTSVFSHRRIIPGISVDEGVGIEMTGTHRPRARMPISVGYRFEVTSVDADDVFFCVSFGLCEPSAIDVIRGRNILSPIMITFHADGSDDPMAPTRGYRARAEAEHASGPTGSDFRYHRISGEASYYLPFGSLQEHVVASRFRFGWVEPLASTAEALGMDAELETLLHPRKRFFAGGARSVRGFAENQLGPRILTIPREELLEEDRCLPEEIADRSCDPAQAPIASFAPRAVGGTSILEGSLEYRFPIGSLTAALFVDAAVVGTGAGGLTTDGTGAITPGFGARFASPVGPIRIDLGIRPRLAQDLRVITELTEEGGERRLVELERRRTFDLTADEGTLSRALSRLTLHLSIGEAF